MSTALRQKFIDYMTLRRLSPRTQKAYTNAVAGFATYFHKSPDTLDDDQSQAYLLHLIKERRLAWNSCNVVFSGLRLFYGELLKWEQPRFSIPPRPRRKWLNGEFTVGTYPATRQAESPAKRNPFDHRAREIGEHQRLGSRARQHRRSEKR